MYSSSQDSDEYLESHLHFEDDVSFDIIPFQKYDPSNAFSPLNIYSENEIISSINDLVNRSNLEEQISTPRETDNSSRLKLKKKRGRQNNKLGVQHDKMKNDNKMAKIQRSYFNYLIDFLNIIMENLKIKYKFKYLNGKWQGNVNQKFRHSLKEKTIKDIIFEAPIRQKSTKDKEHNKKIYTTLKDEGYNILLDIMEKNYLYFFEKIYYKNLRTFNLSSFGLNSLEIELPNDMELFNDLLIKNKRDDFDNYKNKMEKCAKKNFINSYKSSSIDDEISI